MKEKRYNSSLLVLMILLLFPFTSLLASQLDPTENESDKSPAILSLEYYYSTENSRNIDTINFNAYFPVKEFKKLNLILYGGLTGTFATGNITQLEGDLNEGTLGEVNYETEAFGVGPGLWVNFCFLNMNAMSIHLEGSGNLIVYNKKFPAGGDWYNFMWRFGPVLKFPIGISGGIGIGYNWMHVSNGQGIGPSNPSYDAQGISLHFSKSF